MTIRMKNAINVTPIQLMFNDLAMVPPMVSAKNFTFDVCCLIA